MPTPELFISTGEVSGDLHGAALLRELRKDRPDLRAAGIGGSHLSGEGMELVAGIEELSLVGITEVLPRLGSIMGLLRKVRRELAERRPLAVLLIDSPDFNLRVAAMAKKLGLPVIYYIGPTLWAWRKGRIETVRNSVDLMLTILPFEEELYTSRGVRARFVGHPLAGLAVTKGEAMSFLEGLGLPVDGSYVALLPGSRGNEIRRHLPVLVETARHLHGRNEGLHFLVPAASHKSAELIESLRGGDSPLLTVVEGNARLCLAAAEAAAVTSGTATLEAALLGTPFVTIYRLAPLSYMAGRLLVRTPYISLPNILAKMEVVREFIQGDCRPDLLVPAIEDLLSNENRRSTMLSRFAGIRKSLSGGADEAAAAAIAAETGLAAAHTN